MQEVQKVYQEYQSARINNLTEWNSFAVDFKKEIADHQ
jgi:hypothetical protein